MIYDPEMPSPAGLTKSVLWEKFGAQLIGDIDDKLLASVDELHNEARRRNYAEERAGSQYRGECRHLDAGVSACIQVLRGVLTLEKALQQYWPPVAETNGE